MSNYTSNNQKPMNFDNPLLKRAFIFLEDGDFKNADKYLEKVLDENPECGEAYLGKLMKELKVRKPEDLKKCKKLFNDRNSFQKIMKFGDYNLKRTMDEYIECIKRNSKSPTVQFGANEQGNKKSKHTSRYDR